MTLHRQRFVFSVVFLVFLGALICTQPSTALSADVYVDINTGVDTPGNGSFAAPYKTFHYALAQLAATDLLHVMPGVYNIANGESDALPTVAVADVTIMGEGPDAIIDGSGAAVWTAGVQFNGSSNVTITGLTFRNFLDLGSNTGISVSGLTGVNTIQDCLFENNDIGVHIEDCSPLVEASRFYDNITAAVSVSANATASPTIRNNLMKAAGTAENGIKIETLSGVATSDPLIYHNTLDNGSLDGIAITQTAGAAGGDIRFNIITNHTQYGINISGGVPAAVDYNDVWSNATADYSGISAGANDISADPLYIADGDIHSLQSTSPCINTIPTAGHPVAADINGIARPQGAQIDMGCYEIVEPFITPGDYYVDVVNGTNAVGNGTASGASAWKNIGFALKRLKSGDPGAYTLHVAPGTYNVGNGESDAIIHVDKSDLTIAGTDPTTTIIDGSGATSWTVGFEIKDAAGVQITGLMFRNFLKSGIFINNANPSIFYNKFLDNAIGIEIEGNMAAASPDIVGNLIWEEIPSAMQHGITMEGNSAGGVVNPRIYFNTIDGGTGDGIRLITNGGTATPDIEYNIITDFGQYGINNAVGTPVLDYNNVFNNTTANYFDGGSVGANAISALPQYAGAPDYHLQAGSPCVDTIPNGTAFPAELVSAVSVDLDGSARPLPGGGSYDMGCYEHLPIPPGTHYLDINNGSDATGDGSAGTPWQTFHYALSQLNPGDSLYIQPGDYSIANGETDAPLEITADDIQILGSGSGVILDGNGAATWTNGIRIAANNVVVTSIRFTNFSNAVFVDGNFTGVEISGCDMEFNTFGIFVSDASPAISRNWMQHNTTGIYVNANTADASPIINNNLIATDIGAMQAGIYIFSTATGSSTGAQIFHNTLNGGGADGIYVEQGGGAVTPDIRFNIISNFSGYGISNIGGTPTIDYNTVFGNITANYNGIAAGANDISTDPLYFGANDYHLTAASPCIDTIPQALNAIIEDIESNARPLPNAGSNKDMGCFEMPGPLSPGTYYVSINTGNDATGDGSAGTPWQTLHKTFDSINAGVAGAYTVIVAAGDYNITNGEKDAGLVLYQDTVTIAGTDPATTLINGANAIWWENGLEIGGANIDISGLTIKNFALNGIRIYNASPVIHENMIVDNIVGVNVHADSAGASPVLRNNLIAGITAGVMDEGVEIEAINGGDASPVLQYNTISNGALDGILIDAVAASTAAPDIKYNIISNFSEYGINANNAAPVIDYNTFFNNSFGAYNGAAGGGNDIAADPLFVAASDYHLTSASPCIDAIPQAVENTNNTDLEGTTRPMPASGDRDMGCYEYVSTSYILSVSVSAAGSGSVTGPGIDCPAVNCSQNYMENTNVTLTATPADGYEFVQWEDGASIFTSNPLTIAMTISRNLTAVFSQIPQVTLTIDEILPAGSGAIDDGLEAQINCPDDCTGTYSQDSAITLEATAESGYVFENWSDGTNTYTDNPLTITMDADVHLSAAFTAASQTTAVLSIASISPSGGGRISDGGTAQIDCPGDCSGTYTIGTTVNLTAVPVSGYQFTEWSDGVSTYTQNPLYIPLDSDFSISAVFSETSPTVEALTIKEISPAGSGSVNDGSGAQISCPDACTTTYATGSIVTLQAVAQSGFQFAYWDDGATRLTSNPLSVTMDAPKTLTAVFSEIPPLTATVTIETISPLNAGTVNDGSDGQINCPEDCEGDYAARATVTLQAVPESGFQFAYWDDGISLNDDNPLSFQIDTNRVYNAVFSRADNLPPGKPEAISPTDRQRYDAGTSRITLQASAYSDPEGDAHQRTHWIVRQVDRQLYAPATDDPSFDTITDTSAGLTTHTVTGLNDGMQYTWKVGYQDTGSNRFSWSETYRFTIGTSTTQSNVRVPGGTEPASYQMVSFTQWPDDDACTALASTFPQGYDIRFVRMGTYVTGRGSYIECDQGMRIKPGRAFWLLAREGLQITMTGVPVTTKIDLEIPLEYVNGNGWNMIACPNDTVYSWRNVEVVAYGDNGNIVHGPTRLADLSSDNDLIDTRLWRWENGRYQDDTILMQPHQGYWIFVKQDGLLLKFPVKSQNLMAHDAPGRTSLSSRRHLQKIAHEDPTRSPPPPMFAGNDVPDAEEGGGACFVGALSLF